MTKFVLFLTDFHCFGLISLERKTPEGNWKGYFAKTIPRTCPVFIGGVDSGEIGFAFTGQVAELNPRAVSDWKHEKALFEQKNGKLEL